VTKAQRQRTPGDAATHGAGADVPIFAKMSLEYPFIGIRAVATPQAMMFTPPSTYCVAPDSRRA
jgi:hypothetical protein